MSLILSIDGNIGCGKSTLVNNLKRNFKNEKIVYLEEPVDQWVTIKENNKNILEIFYEDQVKYSFCFQVLAYISRLILLKKAIKNNPDAIIITERSLYTDKYIFAKMLYETKKMNSYEYQIYNKWFNEFIIDLPEHKFIYIKSTPQQAYNQMLNRNRKGENDISLDYLTICNKYHEDMFKSIKPDLVIDMYMYDMNINKQYYDQMVKYVYNHINSYNKYKYIDNIIIKLRFIVLLSIIIFYYFYKM